VRELLVIGADSVTVRGLTFQNTGSSQATDRAALRVVESAGCLIENNRFENTLFGIYLQRASACLVRRNHLRGIEGSQTVTGNGLHLWSSRDIVLEDNVITGHRDGIYFEFVTNGVVRRNISERSHRYGLHFMFSDSCRYEDNTFRDNESGVAVMYSKRVRIAGNTFERNRGSAAYGLLLKEITDSEVLRNQFIDNSAALHLEGSSRNAVIDQRLRAQWLGGTRPRRCTGQCPTRQCVSGQCVRRGHQQSSQLQHVRWQLVGPLSRLRSGPQRARRCCARTRPAVCTARGAIPPSADPDPQHPGRFAGCGGTGHADVEPGNAARPLAADAPAAQDAIAQDAIAEDSMTELSIAHRAPLVDISALTKSYGRRQVLKGIDLTIARHAVTAIIGPNGAGKTTLNKALLGFVRPDGGIDSF
jgi:parallel beta-helix repeat protein